MNKFTDNFNKNTKHKTSGKIGLVTWLHYYKKKKNTEEKCQKYPL